MPYKCTPHPWRVKCSACHHISLGPLHTWAKSCDLVIVRTLDSHPKAVLCSHGPSSMVWSENGPCCGPVAYFVGRKEGRIGLNIICLKLYQFDRITWWCLYVLKYVLKSILKYAMLEKLLKKSWSPEIFVRPTSKVSALSTNEGS